MHNFQRLHKSAVIVTYAAKIKDFIIPLFVSLFAGGTGSASVVTRWLFPAILIFLLVYSVLYWFFFRYHIEENELKIRHGIFVKKNRYIRRNRIQSLDITAGVFHRLFGVVKMKIETAGGGLEPEVDLAALSKQEAERLRRALGVEDVIADEKAEVRSEEKEFEYHVPFPNIVAAGLTSGKVGIIFSAAAAFLSQIEQFIPSDFYENSIGYLLATGTYFLVLLCLLIAIMTWLLAALFTVLQYGQFKVRKKENELIIERGILEKRQLTLQVDRITSIRYVTNPIRQLLGMWSIYVDSAGGGSKEENLSTILLPLAKKPEINALMKEVLPEAQFPESLEKLPRRAAPRYMFRTSVLPWIGAIPALLWLPNGWLYLVVPVFFTWFGWQRFKDSGVMLTGRHCVLQTRIFNLCCSVIPHTHIQSIASKQSYFQRKKGLYTLSADVLTTTGGRTFQVKDTDEREQNIFDWYEEEKRA
ncbi:PH domain-containing protein [Bacillus piscicola]|uniref:PH domain-containing protein n=1 Tax=Bacillus piscicola TaxID=1632684 RepID=UPI001F094AEE|nr:PH domain-containing protein [Bacillus piscicola]